MMRSLTLLSIAALAAGVGACGDTLTTDPLLTPVVTDTNVPALDRTVFVSGWDDPSTSSNGNTEFDLYFSGVKGADPVVVTYATGAALYFAAILHGSHAGHRRVLRSVARCRDPGAGHRSVRGGLRGRVRRRRGAGGARGGRAVLSRP